MTRIVIGMGLGGLTLAVLAAFWLGRPLERLQAQAPLEVRSRRPSSVPEVPAPHPPEPRATAVLAPRPLPETPSGAVEVTPAPGRLTPGARRALPESRLKLVRALRAAHASPLARRDAVLAAFQASGESQAPWTQQARAALDTWRTTIEAEVLPIHADPPRCYAAGCVTRVTFPDPASYEEARQRVPGLSLDGVGPHMQLPPEHLPSGEVVVSWAVLPAERR